MIYLVLCCFCPAVCKRNKRNTKTYFPCNVLLNTIRKKRIYQTIKNCKLTFCCHVYTFHKCLSPATPEKYINHVHIFHDNLFISCLTTQKHYAPHFMLHNSYHLSTTRGGSPAGCTCLILKSQHILIEPVRGINLLNALLLPETTMGYFETLFYVKNKLINISMKRNSEEVYGKAKEI